MRPRKAKKASKRGEDKRQGGPEASHPPGVRGAAQKIAGDIESADQNVRGRERWETGRRLSDDLEAFDDARNPVSAEVQERKERADEHHFPNQGGGPTLQIGALQDEDRAGPGELDQRQNAEQTIRVSGGDGQPCAADGPVLVEHGAGRSLRPRGTSSNEDDRSQGDEPNGSPGKYATCCPLRIRDRRLCVG